MKTDKKSNPTNKPLPPDAFAQGTNKKVPGTRLLECAA
jgi:hypothetical protein